MRRLRKQFPDPGSRAAGHRRGDIAGRVAQINRINPRRWRETEERRGKREYAAAVSRRALGEHANDAIRIARAQLLQRDELRRLAGRSLRAGKRHADCAPEGEGLHALFRGPRAHEDGAEDAGEVERVERRGEARGDDVARGGERAGGLLGGEAAALDAVDLQVDPPDAWDGEEQPEDAFLEGGRDREDLEEEEVGEGDGEDGDEAEGEEEGEEEGVDGRPEEARGRRGDGEEGRDGGAWVRELGELRGQ